MAILHFRLHGPPRGISALQRLEYLSAELPHFSRGEVEQVESGNLPEFAKGSARVFWCATDEQERINARVFSEIEAALPYELTSEQNQVLAGAAVHDFLGDRFPYTMAIHSLLDAESRLQRHMHIIFCVRAVTEATGALSPLSFFKRNGAKKDGFWNKRDAPYLLRVRWCYLLNRSLAEAGLDIQLFPGKKPLGSIEPKIVGSDGVVDSEAVLAVKEIRKERRKIASLIEKYNREAAVKIAAIEAERDAKLVEIDKLAAML